MRYSPCSCCPPKPPQQEGVLLPRIVAHERLSFPRVCTEVRITPMPECACAGNTLKALWADGCQPKWHYADKPDLCGNLRLCLSIPVQAQLTDSCGRPYTACASLETEAVLPHRFGRIEGCMLFIQPHVHLLCAESTCDTAVFKVQVSIVLDVYQLKMEPCISRACRPACPDLPLYPPPMH